jgi:outer membrane protein
MKSKAIITLGLVLASFLGFSQKFAFVDTDYILENISEYRIAQEQLEQLSITWQKEIEEKFAEVDRLYKAYQAEALLLPEDVRKKRENEIIAKEKDAKELQKKRFGKEGDLFKKRQELIKPIQDKVYAAIEEIAVAGGYAVIFDKAGSTTLLYSNAKFDKSDEVLAKLGYKAGGISTGEKE